MIHQRNPLSKFFPDIQDVETQASPSLISIKQSDLRIIIDDFPEDESEPSSPVKQNDPVFLIEKMIEEIKHASKKKRVVGDLSEYYTCHSCRSVLDKKFLIHCTEVECQRYFCLRCSKMRFSLLPEGIYDIMKLEDWNCFSCQGLCKCKICEERFRDKTGGFSKDNRKQEITTKLEPSDSGNAFRNSQINPFIGRTGGFDENGQRTGFANSQLVKTPRGRVRKSQNDEIQNQSEDQINQININIKIKEKKARPKRRLSNKKIKRTKGRCHVCGNRPADSPLLTCSVKSCKIQFCSPCSKAKFVKMFPNDVYVPRSWECYSCKGGCSCAECTERKIQESQVKKPKSRFVETVFDAETGKKVETPKRIRSKSSNKRFTEPSTRSQGRKILVIDDSGVDVKVEETVTPFLKTIPAVPSYDSSAKKDPEIITLDKKDIDDSLIISEINIDSACITLYDAENEEQLMNEFQKKNDF